MNIKSYKIKTIRDIVDVVNTKNLKDFLADFSCWLDFSVNFKEKAEKAELQAVEIEITEFIWNDDSNPGVRESIHIIPKSK